MNHEITIVGAGVIGRALAGRLANAGWHVRIAVRDPEGAAAGEAREAVPEVPVVALTEAMSGGGLLLVAIPGANLADFIATSAAAIGDSIVIDATNNTGGPRLHGLEDWQRLAPEARVVRAFCSSGWETFSDPVFDGVHADLFYCGPAGEPSDTVEAVAAAIGLRPVRIGDETAADTLDGVARLWFQLAFSAGRGRNIAFKLLER
jgi:predicted dinucleotide-binding enzyme